jgi:hypothetical protein
MHAFLEPAREAMATARDRVFRILTEREICEILKDPVGRTPREVAGVALDKRAKSALLSVVGFSGFDECEDGTSYWGTWGAV